MDMTYMNAGFHAIRLMATEIKATKTAKRAVREDQRRAEEVPHNMPNRRLDDRKVADVARSCEIEVKRRVPVEEDLDPADDGEGVEERPQDQPERPAQSHPSPPRMRARVSTASTRGCPRLCDA